MLYNAQQYSENKTTNENPFMKMSFLPVTSTCSAAANKSVSDGSSLGAELKATAVDIRMNRSNNYKM